MSGIKIQIKNEKEKAALIKDYLAPDELYLQELEALKQAMISRGVDLDSRDGKREFILAVRELNSRFGAELHRDVPGCSAT